MKIKRGAYYYWAPRNGVGHNGISMYTMVYILWKDSLICKSSESSESIESSESNSKLDFQSCCELQVVHAHGDDAAQENGAYGSGNETEIQGK